ncbi:hypothetical protein H4R24_001721 [Coemansia sp. RSA 988]|nr:hypothetical protein H4R24_001721 [Coemansia sp. RSA 988]
MMGLFSSCFGEVDDYEQHSYSSSSSGSRRDRHSQRAVTKAMIGAPSNFVHTGHLGIGTVQSGSIPTSKDPEKLKTLMSQVSAALDEESLFGSPENPKDMHPSSPSSTSPSSVRVGITC